MIQPTLFDNTATAEKPENVAGQLDSLVRPWCDYSRPFYWRRNQLQKEAERIGQKHIVYRSGEYGRSLVVSREIRDTFYRQHEAELWPNDGGKRR